MATVFSWNSTGLFLVLSACCAYSTIYIQYSLVLLPRWCSWLFTSQGHHKPQRAPSPHGLGELFLWLQALPDVSLSPASCGTAELPHLEMLIWVLGAFRCLAPGWERQLATWTLLKVPWQSSFRDKFLKYGEMYYQEMFHLKNGGGGKCVMRGIT